MEWLRIIGITVTMIIIGYLVLRVIGKRTLSEMSIFHVFLVLILANVLASPIRADYFAELIIPTLIIIAAFYLHSYLTRTNKFWKKIKAEPIVLVRHGNIDENGLNKAKMTISETLAELRVKGYSHVKDVEFAILEETGKISVIPNAAKRPASPQDLSIVTGYEGLPVSLVMDGVIQYDNLAKINMSPEDLKNRLGMLGYPPEMIKTIALAVLDEKKNIMVDQNDDTNQSNIDQEQQNLIKKIQEDLQASAKAPEDQDLGLADDYIKP